MIGDALAAAAHKLGADRDGVLARIGGPLGAQARTAAAQLATLDAAKHKLARAEVAARARAPVPPGFRGVHPTWIEHALAALPARARAAVAAGGGEPVDVWLARWATAELPALPEVRAGAPRTPDDVAALDARAVAAWLARAGSDQLAFALGAAGDAAFTAAERVLGDELRAARARIAQPPRRGQLGPLRDVLARCDGMTREDEIRVVEIGALAAAPHLSVIVRRQVVVRLPHALGRAVADAFRRGAATSPERCPTWTALAAP